MTTDELTTTFVTPNIPTLGATLTKQYF